MLKKFLRGVKFISRYTKTIDWYKFDVQNKCCIFQEQRLTTSGIDVNCI